MCASSGRQYMDKPIPSLPNINISELLSFESEPTYPQSPGLEEGLFNRRPHEFQKIDNFGPFRRTENKSFVSILKLSYMILSLNQQGY